MLSSSELIAAFAALSTSALSTKTQKVNKAYKNQFFFPNWKQLITARSHFEELNLDQTVE